MGRVLIAEIAAVTKGWQVICTECITNAEFEEIQEDQILTWPFIEESEEMFFCDRCKKKLK